MSVLRGFSIILIGLLCLFFSNKAFLAPVERNVLTTLKVEQNLNEIILSIYFSFPVAYKWHYPQLGSDILLVGVDAIITSKSDKPVLKSRESLLPLPEGPPYVQDITYDGTDIYGPYLLIEFEKSVNYKVQQGKDYRSIRIIIERSENKGEEGVEIIN